MSPAAVVLRCRAAAVVSSRAISWAPTPPEKSAAATRASALTLRIRRATRSATPCPPTATSFLAMGRAFRSSVLPPITTSFLVILLGPTRRCCGPAKYRRWRQGAAASTRLAAQPRAREMSSSAMAALPSPSHLRALPLCRFSATPFSATILASTWPATASRQTMLAMRMPAPTVCRIFPNSPLHRSRGAH